MKRLQFCIVAAISLAIPAAAAAQDATEGPDAPMRQIFQAPGAVAFMTAPTPGEGGRVGLWTWVFLKQPIPGGANALALQWDIDCAGQTTRTVRTAVYREATRLRTDAGIDIHATPAPGTPGAVTMAAACATARPRAEPLPTLAAARASAAQTFAAQP
jgi:hypothetical protein